jgi:uncharacterized membrane protein
MVSKSYFRTVRDVERVACRLLTLGFALVFVGIVLVIAMSSNVVGFATMVSGGAIIFGGILVCVLISKISSETMDCLRCSKPIPVFSEDPYVRCPYCGYIAVLRE